MRLRTAMLALLAVLVLAAGPGLATHVGATLDKGLMVPVEHKYRLFAGDSYAPKMLCPRGDTYNGRWFPIGAGVSFESSPRSLRLRGWGRINGGAQVYAVNVSNSTQNVDGTVLCLRVKKVTPYGTTRPLKAGKVSTEAEVCPSGTRRVGAFGGGGKPEVLASYPIDGGWAIKFDNGFANAKDTFVYVSVSCVPREELPLHAPQTVTRRYLIPGNSQATKFLTCPRDTELINGGFRFSSSGAMLLAANEPAEFGSPPLVREAWKVAMVNRGAQSEVMDIYAVCLAELRPISRDK
jgi:hypothetical protein